MSIVGFNLVTPGLVPAPRKTQKPKFQLLTLEQLKALPRPAWIIKGLFREESQVVLYGPSGHGKSFVAIDWAMSIATGRPWHGRKVKRGPVVYVVAEGGRGIQYRVIAWMRENDVADLGPAFFLLDAVQMAEPQHVQAFLDALDAMMPFGSNKPLLIVLDTFARTFIGGEENSAKDVGLWIEASRQVQTATGATVVAVHHSGKPKADGSAMSERGSSALRGAAETMWSVVARGERVTLSCTKQKDDKPSVDIQLTQKEVFLGFDEDDEAITSVVLLPSETRLEGTSGQTALSAGSLQALDALRAFPKAEASSGEWKRSIRMPHGNSPSDSSFHRWRRDLTDKGLVAAAPGAGGVYRVAPTPMTVSSDCQKHMPSEPVTTTTPPMGVEVRQQEGELSGTETVHAMDLATGEKGLVTDAAA